MPRFARFALTFLSLLSLVASASIAPAQVGRDQAPRAKLSNTPPPPGMRVEDFRPTGPVPGAAVPTDPRDGIRRDRGPLGDLDPELRATAERILAKAALARDGGDDVTVRSIRYLDAVKMDVADNGDIFYAIGLSSGSPDFDEWIEIYKSTDGGTTFSLWGTLNTSGDPYERLYGIDVVNGIWDYVYVWYMYFNPGRGGFDMRVAYADPSASSATFNVRTVMKNAGVSFLGPDLTTDVFNFNDFYVYAVCAGLDGSGDDIWFSRSEDYGNSWSMPYRIADLSSSGNLMYSRPHVAYGVGGRVHVAWTYTERLQSTFDDQVRTKQAANYGDTSADWSTTTYVLHSSNDGIDQNLYEMVTSGTSGNLALMVTDRFNLLNPTVYGNAGGGETWAVTDEHPTPFYQGGHAVWNPVTDQLVALGQVPDGTMVVASAPMSDVSNWSDPVAYSEIFASGSGSPAIAVDPSRGHRPAIGWRGVGGVDSDACFDAQWRGDPGHPNYEPGFPVALPTEPGVLEGGRTNPLITNVDADPYDEIVFSNYDGNVYVVSHVGTIPGGWPQDIGTIAARSSVAVGDLNGDGEVEIVAGNTDGLVYCWDSQANLKPGFPVNLGTGASVFVSIGATGHPYPRWIVAASGDRITRISYRGEVQYKSGTLNGQYKSAPAIGDIDDDGDTEVVTNFRYDPGGSGVHVYNADWTGGVQEFRSFPGEAWDAITLGDLDGDGDLEICHPTNAGALYVMHHDLTDVAGFPYSNGVDGAFSAVAFDQILGTFEPELLFSSPTPNVHVVYYDGVEQSSFPADTGSGWFVYGQPIATAIEGATPYVVVGSRDQKAWAFRNIGAIQPPGWPKDLGDRIEVAAAASDIDKDGRNEIVFLGREQLHVVDVGTAPGTAGVESWPMYGHDPQRTGCYECTEDIATAVGDPVGPTRVAFRLDSRNPSSGPVSFAATLPTSGVVELEVFDLRGRRVQTVVRSEAGAGTHLLHFDGRDGKGARLARGHYFARLSVRGDGYAEKLVRKFTLVD